METIGGRTDRRTAAKQYALPSSKGGIKIEIKQAATLYQIMLYNMLLFHDITR